MSYMLQRVVEALEEADEAPFDGSIFEHFARAALKAMKYEDGVDEDVLIDASNKFQVEAVSLSECWDYIIDTAISEDE